MRHGIAAFFIVVLILATLAPQSIKAGESELATCILQQPPFAPTDIDLFNPQVYGSVIPLEPAPEYTVDELKLRQLVLLTLWKRFPLNPSAIKAGLALMDDPQVQEAVPDPRLRAALAMLKGTPGEGAIDTVKSGDLERIRFGSDFQLGTSAAAALLTPSGKTEAVIHERFQYENPREFSSLIGHEAMHLDNIRAGKEELMSSTVEMMIRAQMIAEDPGIARSGTEHARRQNTKLMALLNSRDTDGHIRMTVSQGNVYPDGLLELANFAAAPNFQPLANDSPGNTALLKAVRIITRLPVTNANFDDATLNLLDENLKSLNPYKWVLVAWALKLDLKSALQTCVSYQ